MPCLYGFHVHAVALDSNESEGYLRPRTSNYPVSGTDDDMHNPIQIWCADSFAGIDLQLVVDIGLYNTTLTSRGFSALCFLPSVAGVAECDLIIKFYFLDFNVYIIYLDL